MDESIFAALEGFESIWRRVTASGDAASFLRPAPGHAQTAYAYGPVPGRPSMMDRAGAAAFSECAPPGAGAESTYHSDTASALAHDEHVCADTERGAFPAGADTPRGGTASSRQPGIAHAFPSDACERTECRSGTRRGERSEAPAGALLDTDTDAGAAPDNAFPGERGSDGCGEAAAALFGLVLDAAVREAELCSLARRAKSAQRQLSCLAARQAQRRRLLETEAFLLTGEAVRPASAGPGYCECAPTAGGRSCAYPRAQAFRRSQRPGVLTALRRVCLSADASAAALLRLAAQCGSGGASRVYLRLADGERELSAELRRMIAAML